MLDNCEHLVGDVAELVSKMLRAGLGFRTLVTSREPLRVNGERVWRVRPLTVPEKTGAAETSLTQYESVELFVDRARAVVPDFTINPSNVSAVAQVVRRLEGIPLAIEFAASQLGTLSLNQLLNRTQNILSLPTAGCRGVLPRQRSLREMIDWSFELCTPEERRLWARMSIFSTSFSLETAEAVCDNNLNDDVIDLLRGLVEKSILVHEPHGSYSRYRPLEISRRYGYEKLTISSEKSALRLRHLDHLYRLTKPRSTVGFG